MIDELVLATANKDKIIELQKLLKPVNCISMQSLSIKGADENGLSFIENAIIKARHASNVANKPALADDSGLVVEALNGEPGIYSARFAGINASNEENKKLLIQKLANFQDEKRKAYFYCAIALLRSATDPTPLIAIGRLDGYIHDKEEGEYGFGYDPLFYLPEYKCTLAKLGLEKKNIISHRAQALINLKKLL